MDGATDGAIRLEALREFAADFKAPIFTQFDDSVVAVSAPDFLEPHGLDMHKLITGFLSRYGDVADFLVAVTDLPANSPLYSYAGLYVDVRNTVRGTGKGIFDRDRPGFGEKLKGWIHLSYFSPSFFPEALRHEIPTRWRPAPAGPYTASTSAVASMTPGGSCHGLLGWKSYCRTAGGRLSDRASSPSSSKRKKLRGGKPVRTRNARGRG